MLRGGIKLCFFLFASALLLGAAEPSKPAVSKPKVTSIVVLKSQRTLTLYSGSSTLKTYKVALGGVPIGAKQQEGDHKTPEGHYVIDSKNSRSKFHLSLHISYPTAEDRKRALSRNVRPGGDIMIHGLPPAFAWMGAAHRNVDWTEGCIAVTNPEIEEIYNQVPIGTPIDIRP